MSARIILGIGSGRCGTASLANVLNRQSAFSVTHEEWPLLAWRPAGDPAEIIAARFERMRRQRTGVAVVGDVASFYLPYLPAALEQESDLRVVCLKRPREEVVASFEKWLDRVFPVRMDFWTDAPGPEQHHDPRWTPMMPQYDEPTRAAGVRRYWDEYYGEVERLQDAWPEQVRVFPTEGLNDRETLRELLEFVGVPDGTQVLSTEVRANVTEKAPDRMRPQYEPDDPRRCVILVPFQESIMRPCEKGLIELERRGYEVRRVSGFANIDLGRSQMATDSLIAGFEETMWIDADVEFDPDDVDRLRSHGEPITAGIYPKKGQRALACHVLRGTKSLTFGKEGGLTEIRYAATGFLHVRRRVYETLQCRLPLPVANTRFGRPLVPFFEPMTIADADGHWTMTEDYSFCERARRCGFRILADTSIRLTHHGTYGYTWEDAGFERKRFATYRYNFND